MKDFDYYSKVEIPYPSDKDYINVFLYDNGGVLFHGTWWEWHHNREKYPSTAVKQEVFDKEGYKKAKDAYHREEQRLYLEFTEDIAREFGVHGNPKADLLFSIAWEFGHSAGYSEVYGYYGDLVDLIR